MLLRRWLAISSCLICAQGWSPAYAQYAQLLSGLVHAMNSKQPTNAGDNDKRQQNLASTSNQAPDNPLVRASTPPPPEAKLITKVEWCEVQVFGHTFSNASLAGASRHIHLPERLEQLSRKLHFEPEKSGIQLMDNVDELLKFVYASRNGVASPSPSSQAPVTEPNRNAGSPGTNKAVEQTQTELTF